MCCGATCLQGDLALSQGADKLDFLGEFNLDDTDSNYINATVKCFKEGDVLHNEIAILRQLGTHKNVMHFLTDYCDKRPIKGAPRDCHYYIAAFEFAPLNWDSLLLQCFKEKNKYTAPSFSFIRSVCQQLIAALKHLHNQGITHGNITEEAIRWSKKTDTEEMCVKLTDLGYATFQNRPLGHEVFKREVRVLGLLLRKLFYRKVTMSCEKGSRDLFDTMINAMTNEDLFSVPCLELVSSCMFLMSDARRAHFVFQAALGLKSDSAYIYCMKRENKEFSEGELWQHNMPKAVLFYILRNKEIDKKAYKLRQQYNLSITINQEIVRKVFGSEGSKDCSPLDLQFTVAQTFDQKFLPISSYYTNDLLGLLRFCRNIIAHPFDIDLMVALELSAYSPANFVKFVIDRQPFFASEIERLVYATKYNESSALTEFQGNKKIIEEGGGCLFKESDRLLRAKRTKINYETFQKEVLSQIDRLNLDFSAVKILESMLTLKDDENTSFDFLDDE